MRKTYQPNYIPIEEERIAKAVDLCAGHAQAPYAETAVVTEGASQSDEMGQDEDYLNIDAQDAGNFYRSADLGKHFSFISGAVCGMLVVFVYFHLKGASAQISANNKVIRRPEL